MRARWKTVDAVFIQAGIAAALSFSHIAEIAEAAGQSGWKMWAYPISVDLLLFASWRLIRAGKQKGAAWAWFTISLAASLGANIGTAGVVNMNDVPVWLSVVVGGWPAVAFLGGTLLVHGRTREDAPEAPAVEVPVPPLPPSALTVDLSTLAALTPPPVELPDATPAAPDPVDTPSPVVTVAVAAEALGIPASTIRGWASDAQGRIRRCGYEGRALLVDITECRAQMARTS